MQRQQHLDIALDSFHAAIKSSPTKFLFPFIPLLSLHRYYYLTIHGTTLLSGELRESVRYRHRPHEKEEANGFGVGSRTRARPPDIEGPSEIHSTVYRTARYRPSRTVGVGG